MTDFTPARLAELRAVAELLSGSTFAATLDDYSNVGRVAFYPLTDELMCSRMRVVAFFENLPETLLALIAALEAKTAEVDRVKALHRKALAVFSWSEGGVRYEAPCENCNGAPGVHACGCWADEQTEYVCAECDRDKGKHRDSRWPCATIQAIEGEE